MKHYIRRDTIIIYFYSIITIQSTKYYVYKTTEKAKLMLQFKSHFKCAFYLLKFINKFVKIYRNFNFLDLFVSFDNKKKQSFSL